MVDTDVFIAFTEFDLYHMILLLPHSVVLAIAPNHLQFVYLNAVAESASLLYLPVFNASSPIPLECKQKDGLEDMDCIHLLQTSPIEINYGQLHNYMRIAATHVQIKKYRAPLGKQQ